jgi:hypothetical protein
MELSDTERKMVDYLRMQHKGWRQLRWIMLVGAVVLLVLNVMGKGGDLALYGIVGFLLSYVLGGWSGRPEITLLLRLVEERLHEGNRGRTSDPDLST